LNFLMTSSGTNTPCYVNPELTFQLSGSTKTFYVFLLIADS
jgi:hypothetical protein